MSANIYMATKNDKDGKNEMDGEKMTWRAKISVDKSTVSENQ